MAEIANFIPVFILPLLQYKNKLNPFFWLFKLICIDVSFSLMICLISILRQSGSVPLLVPYFIVWCLFLYYPNETFFFIQKSNFNFIDLLYCQFSHSPLFSSFPFLGSFWFLPHLLLLELTVNSFYFLPFFLFINVGLNWTLRSADIICIYV